MVLEKTKPACSGFFHQIKSKRRNGRVCFVALLGHDALTVGIRQPVGR